MLKTLFLIALALCIAIGGGVWSVLFALDHSASIGATTIGPWIAHPDSGTREADPYTRARDARDGSLALGHAEGIEFRATHDASGAPLSLTCRYRLTGQTPPARFWTLYAMDEKHRLVKGVGLQKPAVSSLNLLREGEQRHLSLSVGSEPSAGNWLAISGEGSMQLVLTLYDTPIANRADVSDSALPLIELVDCNG